ncbi:MAG: hypothetical protein EA350_12475 [Gemmatimonadales bacterium]|nr:MAG: hypothetical protein EA350_12475 [Gemmatimonadales bacterium]
MFEALIAITAIIVLFGLPLGGLVIRFALRPLVKDIANAIRSNAPVAGDPAQLESLNRRLERIEQSLVEQEAISARLLEVQEFDRKLRSGLPDPASREE